MISIFEYLDYRKYLKDYYDNRKTEDSAFSYQSFADKAGLTNRGFIYNTSYTHFFYRGYKTAETLRQILDRIM